MRKFVLVMAAAVFVAQTGYAGDVEDLKRENAELRQRVGVLENKLDEVLNVVDQLKSLRPTPPAASAPVLGLSPQELEQLKGMAHSQQNGLRPVMSSVDARFYGFIKADTSYDSSLTSAGNFARWVESERFNKNDDQFDMTANQTRLGVDFSGPADDTMKTTGKVEVDFYGNGAAENKPDIMMRHAYMKFEWPESRLSLLAGQTWDVISPLNPGVLNYAVQWWAGNIGYRRPQIRVTKGFTTCCDADLEIQAAISRSIGTDSGFGARDSGKDSGIPVFQSRIGVAASVFGDKVTKVGFSGHWGEEEYDINKFGQDTHYPTWSANIDLTQPVNDWISVKGEAFVGENLDAYLGGIGQGVDIAMDREIKSWGGWLAANLKPWEKWAFNLGFSFEDVSDNDVSVDSMGNPMRTDNRAIFANGIYDINKKSSVGLELSHWRTEYKNAGSGDSFRAQAAFLYKF